MTDTATWVILSLCFVILLGWHFAPRFRKIMSDHGPLLNVLALVVALTAFIQIHISVAQFNRTQDAAKQDERQHFDARMATLVAELFGDLQVCESVLKAAKPDTPDITVPIDPFHFDALQDLLRTGQLTKHTIRGKLISVYHRMLVADRLTTASITLLNERPLASADRLPAIDARIRQNNAMLTQIAEDVRARIQALIPDFKDFVDNPDKYKESLYLKGY